MTAFKESCVQLTEQQRQMLDGAEGEMAARFMRLLLRLGQIYGAERMVPIASAQISGVSYKSIGDPGLEFLEDVARSGARVKVKATINPAGMDLQAWRELGFPEAFAAKQQRIIAAFAEMGVETTATCTPYLVGNRPERGDHIAWAESSAVSFANSVIGARTNREGGPSALAAAICGCTPMHGLHLPEGRRATVRVVVEAGLYNRADFGALGNLLGRRVKQGIPYFCGIERAAPDDLKTLGAAMAASGAVALYHIEGITPEAERQDLSKLETIRVSRRELEQTYQRLTTGEKPELIVLGCPHASIEEIARLAELLEGKKLRLPLWVCTSRQNRILAEERGLLRTIEAAGARMIADTCMVVAPVEQMGYRTMAVNSGKAAHYLPGFCQQQVVYRDLERLLKEALS